ncbi:hypothetical protein OIU84_029596 [Salix udensis]|uniref:Uncharacterized protein n=1 Tax=Salix udensis TaxID=889485 RepID=A0AAD6K9Q9_9ROSI|nr:hypothetical protein OIU84_029596 [Salix udensis]
MKVRPVHHPENCSPSTHFQKTLSQMNLGSSIGSIQLDTISDGYDDGGFAQAGTVEAYLSRLHDVGPKNLSDLIKRHQTSSSPLHAVIYEPFLAWALEVAKDCGLFAAAFFTHACAVDYMFYNVYHEVLKLPVSSTPVLIEGLPLLLELQDLPSFVAEPDSYPANVKMTMSQFANLDKADRVLINTFYKLENEVVDTMSKACPLLTIGPTIPSIYLDERIEDEDDYDRGREMKMSSKKWKELAIEATSEGGTSDTNINELVAVLRSTK